MNLLHGERDNGWWQELIRPLQAGPDRLHPSRTVLRDYLQGRLPDIWQVSTHPPGPDHWTLTMVSQHALTCPQCAQQLALLRRRELERTLWQLDLWARIPSVIRAHLALYSIALLVLFGLNAFLVMVLPAPTVWQPCLFAGDRVGLDKPSDPTESKSFKIEGLNRPIKLPPSLAGECLPAPAPRPLWQTWWIGWIFLVWTMLLGLHILWEWLVSSTPQRPAPASAT